jgi:integrase
MAKVSLTAGRVASHKCPDGVAQSFLWDKKTPGLAVRATPSGGADADGTPKPQALAYVFQGRVSGKTIRLTIGAVKSWNLDDAKAEARRLQGLIDQGKDPREEKAAAAAESAAKRDAAKVERLRQEVTGLDAWGIYCTERRHMWSERNHADHLAFASAGGVKRKQAKGKTIPGPLHSLLRLPLVAIDAPAVEQWVKKEAKTRPARALLGFRLLRAFLNWCAEHADYAALVQPGACKTKKAREALPKVVAKDDALQREQLPAWFAEVRKLSPVMSAYLQALLITGARREELLGIQWGDVDFQWGRLTIRDKVEGERIIPLTPYVSRLLSALPRRNEWVFASPHGKGGRVKEPRGPHVQALTAGGLPHITLHGLRRSFGTLSEWCEVPVGIVAQIQGHKPSAIAEKHYRVRPIDLLRQWHTKIEAWMLEQAGIAFDASQPQGLHVVSAA